MIWIPKRADSAALVGAILHTINFRLFPEQISYIVNHAADCVIFVDGTLASLLEPLFASGQLSTVRHFVLLGHQRVKTSLRPHAMHNDLVAAASEEFTFNEDLDENTALGLCYTSGLLTLTTLPPSSFHGITHLL